jgi:hypothetical protein
MARAGPSRSNASNAFLPGFRSPLVTGSGVAPGSGRCSMPSSRNPNVCALPPVGSIQTMSPVASCRRIVASSDATMTSRAAASFWMPTIGPPLRRSSGGQSAIEPSTTTPALRHVAASVGSAARVDTSAGASRAHPTNRLDARVRRKLRDAKADVMAAPTDGQAGPDSIIRHDAPVRVPRRSARGQATARRAPSVPRADES